MKRISIRQLSRNYNAGVSFHAANIMDMLGLGAKRKNSHCLAAMIRGYGSKGYWLSAFKLFLHSRERDMARDGKDFEYGFDMPGSRIANTAFDQKSGSQI